MSQAAMLKAGERPAATVVPGERDHLPVVTDTDVGVKGAACKETK